MIIDIKNSNKPNKRFMVILDNDGVIHFGDKNGSTYIDHHDKKKRDNYLKRHYALKKEKPFIDNLIPSPSLMSYMILWGPHKDMYKNIEYLNVLLNRDR
jgi:hypothetical protein